jgi:hypothetical protein
VLASPGSRICLAARSHSPQPRTRFGLLRCWSLLKGMEALGSHDLGALTLEQHGIGRDCCFACLSSFLKVGAGSTPLPSVNFDKTFRVLASVASSLGGYHPRSGSSAGKT